MGLAVFDGQLYPVWAGNLNEVLIVNGAVIGRCRSTSCTSRWSSPRVRGSSTARWDRSRTRRGVNRYGEQCQHLRHLRPACQCQLGRCPPMPWFTTTTRPTAIRSSCSRRSACLPVLSSGSSKSGYTQFTITFDPRPPAPTPYNYTGHIQLSDRSGQRQRPSAIGAPIESYSGPLGGVAATRRPRSEPERRRHRSTQNPLTNPFTGLDARATSMRRRSLSRSLPVDVWPDAAQHPPASVQSKHVAADRARPAGRLHAVCG